MPMRSSPCGGTGKQPARATHLWQGYCLEQYGIYSDRSGSALPMQIRTRDCAEFLVIDDDPLVTRFLATYLQQKGHTCATITDGSRTEPWLEMHDCEVAVVDLNMPKLDGISLISRIRQIRPNVPVIVFTGLGYDEERMHAALRAGANGYVSKNLPIEQLYCVLLRMLETGRERAHQEQVRSPMLGAA